MRNKPNPGIGHHAGSCGEWRLTGSFTALALALQAFQSIEGAEEIAGDGGVVAEILLPVVGWVDQKTNGYGVVGIQIFRAVFDVLLRAGSLGGGSDVEHAGFDATRTQAAPVRLGQAHDQ